jgi:gluconolactonase
MNRIQLPTLIVIILSCLGCQPKDSVQTGSIERIDPSLDEIILPGAVVEMIAEGFEWSEGPLWVENQKMLLFTDVPKNTIYKWTEEKGAEVYLTPSGHTGPDPISNESGANGLALNDKGELLLCQHGDRKVARMNSAIEQPSPYFTSIASVYNGKRFNSPNDLTFYNGDVFFTDPPYGLAADSLREIPFQGVYKVTARGNVLLLIDSLTRPNGIAFSPDHKKMYVANSDPDKARWYVYEMSDSSTILSGKILYDATSFTKTEKGLPDGLKVDSKGNLFATGPGGAWIFNATGSLIGKVKLPEATANCALSTDEKTLYLTSDMYLLRLKLK